MRKRPCEIFDYDYHNKIAYPKAADFNSTTERLRIEEDHCDFCMFTNDLINAHNARLDQEELA